MSARAMSGATHGTTNVTYAGRYAERDPTAPAAMAAIVTMRNACEMGSASLRKRNAAAPHNDPETAFAAASAHPQSRFSLSPRCRLPKSQTRRARAPVTRYIAAAHARSCACAISGHSTRTTAGAATRLGRKTTRAWRKRTLICSSRTSCAKSRVMAHQSPLDRHVDRFSAVCHVQRAQDRGHVRANGVVRDVERVRDRLVGVPHGEELQHAGL